MLIVLVAASALALPTLRFDDAIHRVFFSQNQASRDYAGLLKALGARPSDFILLAESDAPFTPADYQHLRDLAIEIEFSDTIESVLSPFAARFAENDPLYPGEPVFKADLNAPEIAERLAAFRASTPLTRPLIADDGASLIIVATADLDAPGLQPRQTFDAISALAAAMAPPNLRLTVTGEEAMSIAVVDALKDDLLRLNLAGSLLVFVLALVLFRNLRTAMVAIVPALLGALACLTGFVVLGYPITILSNVIPLLVLILGIADSIHLTMHYRSHGTGAPATEQIIATIRDIGPACALTALTTAIAFMAIAASDNDQLFEFAIIGAVSVMVSYFVVIVAFAVLARFCRPAPLAESKRSEWLRVPGVMIDTVFARGRSVIAVSLVCAAAGLWGYSRTEPWFPLYQHLPDTSAVGPANERILDRFGGFFRVWAELDTSGTQGLETDGGWARLVGLTNAIQTAAPGNTVVSLTSLARFLGNPDRMPGAERLADIPETLRRQLVTPDGRLARVVVLMAEPMRDARTLATYDRIESAALSAGAARFVGLPVIMRHGSLTIIRQLGIGLLAACCIAVILVATAFRWPALVFVLLLPNVLPLLVTASALHVLNGGHLNPASVLALTIAFGIAVDDSIHFLTRYRLERARGNPPDAALRTAISRTGRVMIVTTALLSAGLLVTLTSAFSIVRLFGEMLILTFLTALLADLMLLPALLRLKWFRK